MNKIYKRGCYYASECVYWVIVRFEVWNIFPVYQWLREQSYQEGDEL